MIWAAWIHECASLSYFRRLGFSINVFIKFSRSPPVPPLRFEHPYHAFCIPSSKITVPTLVVGVLIQKRWFLSYFPCVGFKIDECITLSRSLLKSFGTSIIASISLVGAPSGRHLSKRMCSIVRWHRREERFAITPYDSTVHNMPGCLPTTILGLAWTTSSDKCRLTS